MVKTLAKSLPHDSYSQSPDSQCQALTTSKDGEHHNVRQELYTYTNPCIARPAAMAAGTRGPDQCCVGRISLQYSRLKGFGIDIELLPPPEIPVPFDTVPVNPKEGEEAKLSNLDVIGVIFDN